MKKLLKNRIFIGAISIIFGLLICFVLAPLFSGAKNATTDIVRANTLIQAGTRITNEMVEVVEVGAYNLPQNVILEKDLAIGKYASVDIYSGDYMLQSKLSDEQMVKNDYLYELDGEERAISFSITSFAKGLSGKIMAGDIISIIATSNGDTMSTPSELQYVEVIATTAENGVDNDIEYTGEDAEMSSTITVLASPKQAELIANLEAAGSIHVALVYRGQNKQPFLDKQQEVLNISNNTME